MSRGEAQRRRRAIPDSGTSASSHAEGASGSAGVLLGQQRSLVAAADHWVSAAVVRQSVGAWAYTLGAGERRPTDTDVRQAVAVASAIAELAREHRRWTGNATHEDADVPPRGGSRSERRQTSEATSQADPLTTPVAVDLPELGRRAGLAPRDTEHALTLLAAARVVTHQTGATVATVSLSEAVLSPVPAVARLSWDVVRGRLEAVEGSIAPALAVLRELATTIGTLDETGAAPPIRASVRDLEDATAFGRSTVSAALVALERSELLTIEARAGRTTRFTIRPAAFGHADVPWAPSNRAGAPDGASEQSIGLVPGGSHVDRDVRSGSPTIETLPAIPSATFAGRSTPASAPSPPAALLSGGAVLVGEFAGTPIYAPPGTPVVIECDGDGRWTCRVGPLLRLGPVDPGT